MSNYPGAFDDDTTLPPVNDNLSQIGGDAINGLKDAVMQIEQSLGLNIAGSSPSLAARIGVFINPDGSPNTSIIYSLGLVTVPITNNQIANNAGIPESKLTLDYRTQDLFNYIRDLAKDVNLAIGWISVDGIKLEPHLIGAIYRHDLTQIDVIENSALFLNNVFRVARDNTDAYTVINDINNELLSHQWADGSLFGTIKNIITNSGATYPSNYAHVASGIFLDTSRFAIIPQTANDVQAFADFIDNASILTLGTRIQNLYSNGISVNSRSSSLTTDGYGQSVIPVTPAIAYLRGTGNQSVPFDDINMGDDIIQFMPSSQSQSNNTFDEKFALVKPGDIITVDYTGDGYNVTVKFIVSEKKYIQGGGNKTYIVRVAGKNLVYSPNATARIDRSLFNNNKYGVLATAGVSTSNLPGVQISATPSLIVGTARGAQTLGINFSPDQFNESHYLLYLALYPDGNPMDGYVFLPGIDVTGNRGTTPGLYTLDGIVAATNNALQQPGYNYRFIAFSYNGEFGIMLADSYNNASFSILSAVVDNNGNYSQSATQQSFPFNVIDVFPTVGTVAPDPLGFGPFGSNIASPPFLTSYASTAASQIPTKLLSPLRRNNYYVNGNEREILSADIEQALDTYGDGYWTATVSAVTVNAGPPGHVSVTYTIPLDLSASKLKAGKTLVVQPILSGSAGTNYGRFIISSVTFGCCPPLQTQITVYDAIHATGFSPTTAITVGTQVAIYFNSDSVSLNNESATDFVNISGGLKRHFEIYIAGDGSTFSHERGRLSLLGTNVSVSGSTLYNNSLPLTNLDLVTISPKLRGYQFGAISKITLNMLTYSSSTGLFTGYLASFDGTTFTRQGPTITGKIGETVRFYDETNIDYIDISFNVNVNFISFTNQYIDIQLFPTLSLDEEVMLISTCQANTSTDVVNQIIDRRQFGNTSEEQFTTSALRYIAFPEKALHFNGPVRGFDIVSVTNEFISITGGLVLVNGSFNSINDQIITIPKIQEVFASVNYSINYVLCVNSVGDLTTIPLTDFDVVLGTPNSPNRVMTVVNVVSSTTYPVDADNFSYILNNRKDLAALYIISSTVTGTGGTASVSLTSRDVRRFVNDSDSNIPAVLTSDNSQGNFKTLSAAANWLLFNSNFQSNLQIKGAFSISNDPGLNFTGVPLTIIGQGSTASLTFNTAMNMSNVVFNNVKVIFASTLTANNVTFNNCNVTFSGVVGSTSSGIAINNSTVLIGATSQFNAVPLLSITGSIVNVNTTSFNCNAFNLVNNTSFVGTTFNYTANPVGTAGYQTTNLVNYSSAMIFGGVTTSLSNLTIKNCIFTNSLSDHYSFIGFRLNTNNAVLQNINISGNQFISLATSNDLRAVIFAASTLTTAPSGSTYPKYPKLINVFIENNICSHDQMILVTSFRPAGPPITSAMLVATNTHISNNNCGTIGFITAGGEVSHADNSNTLNGGFVRNREDQLIIEENTCKLIINLDYNGHFIPFGFQVLVGTGAVSVINNSANWIIVSAASASAPTSDGVTILGNRVSPNDPAYLNNYQDTFNTNLVPPNAGISLGLDNIPIGTTYSIISNNTINQKQLFETNGTTSTFYYANGISCLNNAQIIGNSINGTVSGNASSMILLGNLANMVVQGNILNRQGQTIKAYISGLSSAINTVAITDNVFDSQYVDASNTIFNDTATTIATSWTYTRNVNQVAYAIVPFYAHRSGGSEGAVPITSPLVSVGPLSLANTGGNSTTATFWNFSNSGTFTWYQNIAISSVLPVGVKILYFAAGFFSNALLASNGGFIQMQIATTISTNVPTLPITPAAPVTVSGSLTNTIIDVVNLPGGSDDSTIYFPPGANMIMTTPNAAQLAASTVLFAADMSAAPTQLYTGEDYEIIFSLLFSGITPASASSCTIKASGLLIRYIWA